MLEPSNNERRSSQFKSETSALDFYSKGTPDTESEGIDPAEKSNTSRLRVGVCAAVVCFISLAIPYGFCFIFDAMHVGCESAASRWFQLLASSSILLSIVALLTCEPIGLYFEMRQEDTMTKKAVGLCLILPLVIAAIVGVIAAFFYLAETSQFSGADPLSLPGVEAIKGSQSYYWALLFLILITSFLTGANRAIRSAKEE